ncbi:MAG: fibronectin type III domain-containing protein, partial [Bacteroidota bacterium]|nr:fibronectin type III domain-containing protein [Bacteroidota bacterium]
MRKICTLLTIFIFSGSLAYSQTTAEKYAVQINARINQNPANLTLFWKGDTDASQYEIFRKDKGAATWGSGLATLDGTDTSWTDLNIQAGEAYEYRVVKTTGSYTGYGYLYGGIEVPAVDSRGTIILIVDKTHLPQLEAEVDRLVMDMTADGWSVLRHNYDTGTGNPVMEVKSLIIADYNANPTGVKAVFLLGHIPVPYSGNFAIDGHTDHAGAWPADVFYADATNTGWQDATINNTAPTREANHNIPGDGKFDNDILPTSLELYVGRVDMHNMPAFGLSETELLRRYLDKDHAWRTGQVTVRDKAIVDDHWGAMGGESFSASGFKSFAPAVGIENIEQADFFPAAKANSYLWAYGGGAGAYN